MEHLVQKAKISPSTIVFPEGENPIICAAAGKLAEQGLARPILLVNPVTIQKEAKSRPEDRPFLEIIDPSTSPELERYIDQYCRERDMPQSVGKRIVTQPLCFGAMMVKHKDAGGMVAGIAHPTEDVILASELIIGFQPGIGLASSFFVMEVPGFTGGEDGRIIFADPAVNPDPDPEQLADIAISTAHSARDLLGWDQEVDFREIEILRGQYGEPLAHLQGNVKARAEAKGCDRVFLSLSYETDLAVAMAFAEG